MTMQAQQSGDERSMEITEVHPTEILISAVAEMLDGLRHVAVGASSPIPGSATLLARARAESGMRVSVLGSTRHNFFTDGGRELFDCAAQGRIDAFFLSGGQIDGSGAVNLVGIGPYPESKVRFPGSFGSAYLAFVVPRIILFREEHTPRTLVEQVDFVSAPGVSAPEVYRPGGPCALITGRALFEFPGEARAAFALRSLHPRPQSGRVIERPASASITTPPRRRHRCPTQRRWRCCAGRSHAMSAKPIPPSPASSGGSAGERRFHRGGERIDPQRLRDFATTVLERAGVASADAALVADSLVQADLWGHQSHGVMRLFWYARRIENGATRPDIRPRFHEPGNGRRRALSTLDGGDGIGQVMAHAAMLRAIDAAKDFGIGVVPVRRSGHFGMAMYFTRLAAQAGCIGFLTSNASPAMAPWGGTEKRVGNNPWSWAAPAGRHPPMILDIANTAVARGKLYLARQRGEPIPDDWAIDSHGRPTTDPQAGIDGTIQPWRGTRAMRSPP